MTTITTPRTLRVGVLVDITPSRNIPQSQPTPKNRHVRFAPIASPLPSKYSRKGNNYKPTEDELLCLRGINSGNPNATRSTKNQAFTTNMANFADSSYPMLHSPNMSKRRDKNVFGYRPSTPTTPTTPPVAQVGGEPLVAISESGVFKTPTLAHKFYNGSPLNKPLPSKPGDRPESSPERPGLLDATEQDNTLGIHPVLQPSSSSGASPNDSFKITPSLGSTFSSSDTEYGTGVVVEGQTVTPINGLGIGNSKSITAASAPRMASLSGHSPVHRHSPANRVKRLSTMASNSSLVSLNRRQARSGVGLSIRKAADAHEFIMGRPDPKGPPFPPRTSSLGKHRKSSVPLAVKPVGHYAQVSTAARLSRPTAASSARANESKKPAPGDLYLGYPPHNKPTMIPGSSKSARSYTPSGIAKKGRIVSTASTTASTAMSKSLTVTSLKKGLKSRFSEIFSSRRRTVSSSAISDNSKGYSSLDDAEEEDIILEADFDPPHSATITVEAPVEPANVSDAKYVSHEVMLGNTTTVSTGGVADREIPAKEQQRQARRERRPRNYQINGRFADTEPGHSRHITRAHPSGDGSPSPPPTRLGTVSHYVQAGEIGELESAMTEAELDRFLEEQLSAAEEYLANAVGAANVDPNDPVGCARLEAVISALGESIIAARHAHIIQIRLRVATANMIQYTAQCAASVCSDIMAAAGGQAVAVASIPGTT